jgi:DNA-binding SARP family transcriptional activator/Tfp pilus assembly protein PilF
MSMVGDGASGVEYRLLGPVEVWVGGRRVDAGQPRQRAVLAALLVDAGRVVPTETLIARVWGQTVPEQARATLRTHLSRIRRLLEQAAESTASVASLSRTSGGYLLQVDPDQIDLHRFRRLAATAGRPANSAGSSGGGSGDGVGVVGSLRAALALWRGQPLSGIEGEWAGRMREIWGRERVDTAIVWARAELALANPGPVLASMAELAGDNPLVESVTEVFMLALHAAGRTSEALELYGRTRAQLAEELGTDPGPDLQLLHQSLLRGEISTTPPATPPTPAPGLVRQLPRQLPAPPQLFTGRDSELADLVKLHDASTVVITAIDGMAGIGKTALAVQAAHQILDRYPDGQLFIDLHGYTDAVAPIEPGQALDQMLRSLGVPGERIPTGLAERAGLYRSRLADQRILIVLDNAATETQLAPLLPGAPGCLVLVTSRRRLAGLDHTHTLSLDTLPPADATALLRRSLEENRLAGQPPDLLTELVELCGRLPLAIRIAAARLRSHPTWDLAYLARRLRDQQHRLHELAAGQRSITATLDLSYHDLTPDQQRTYRHLGLHFGPDIDPYATAALLDTDLPEAGRMLDQLLEAHLLQEPAPGRYQFHDLTRAHAAHTATRDEPDHHRQAALNRLLDYYRHTASMAMNTAYPYERERRPHVPPAHTPTPDQPNPTAALTWLNSELPNLLAAARHATECGRPTHLLHLSTILHRHLRTHGRLRDAITLHQQALTTARATGNRAAELEALTGLADITRLQSRYEEATEQYQQALQLARTTGHPGELDALLGLGHIDRLQSWYEQATERYRQALQLARATGTQEAELDALTGLGHIQRRQGQYEQATDSYQQALRLARATAHHSGELIALTGIGHIHRMHGRYEQATEYFHQAQQLAHATGHHNAEQTVLTGLGDIHRRQGHYERAADCYQRLLGLAQQSGNRNYQFEAEQGLGRIQNATGHPDLALTHHDHALALATELGQPDDQARAHDGLAHAHHALHHHEQARTHWQHALDILTQLGIEQTDDEEMTVAAIREHLGLPESG